MLPILFASIPTDLADGRYAAPPGVILALGGLVLVGAVAFLVLQFRRGTRGQQ